MLIKDRRLLKKKTQLLTSREYKYQDSCTDFFDPRPTSEMEGQVEFACTAGERP